jgi:hypothetical protein
MSIRRLCRRIALAVSLLVPLAVQCLAADTDEVDPDVFEKAEVSLENSLRAGDRSAGPRLLKALPPANDDGFIKWFEENAPRFPPEYLFGYALWLFPTDPDRAARWAPLARMRLVNDLAHCTDASVSTQLQEMDRLIINVVEHLKEHKSLYIEAMQWALEWDAANPPPRIGLVSLCKSGIRGLEAASEGDEGDSNQQWVVSDTDSAKIRRQVRASMQSQLEDYRGINGQ